MVRTPRSTRDRVAGFRRAGVRGWAPLALALLATTLACGGATDPDPVGPTSPPPTPVPTGPPNVIIVVGDDLGWGDLGSYGSANKTPSLDRLAESGVRLTQYVTAAPLCTPSRTALLTGLYPVQTRVTSNLGPRDGRAGLTSQTPSLAILLKARGYATAALGKWGVGEQPQNMPLQNGFDSHFGVFYESDDRIFENDALAAVGVPFDGLEREYAARAKAFIRANAIARRPFFLYYASHIPHKPLRTAPEFVGRSGGGAYADAILELDSRVGEILSTLDEAKVTSNTIVLFTSDNGPPSFGKPDEGSPGPFGGVGKGSPYEGGIRVPAIVSWPAGFPGRRVIDSLVTAIDVVPTIAAATGAALPPRFIYFGAEVLPLLRGQVTSIPGQGIGGGREFVAFVGQNAGAFRSGRYKIVWPGWWARDAEFYDLSVDPTETTNLRRSEPAVFDTMAARSDEIVREAARNGI